MSIICPSLTYNTAVEYTAYLQQLEPVAGRIHIDVSDGILAPVRSIGLAQVWWPKQITADIHMMYQRPLEHIEQLVSMSPNLVIVHPEADGDLLGLASHLHQFNIKFGIAIMPDVDITTLDGLLSVSNHALIFSGKLGYYGGHADPARFDQIMVLKRQFPKLEIGWDGGANDANVHAIAHAGIDVINVGSGLSKAADPQAAYAKLVTEIK